MCPSLSIQPQETHPNSNMKSRASSPGGRFCHPIITISYMTLDTAEAFSNDTNNHSNMKSSHFFQTNPPFYCPLVEVCPTPWTRPEVRDSTMTILKEIGEVPVLIKKEVSGFVLNRLQYALMNECWRLVQVPFTLLLQLVLKDHFFYKVPLAVYIIHYLRASAVSPGRRD